MISEKTKFLKLVTILVLTTIVLGVAFFNKFKSVNYGNAIITNKIHAEPVISNSLLRDSIVSFGLTLLGTPYTDGGCGIDGFDCSGLVYYVFKKYHIQVPRSSSQFINFGKEIPIEHVKKGDILVFLSPTKDVIGHVGIVTNAKGVNSDFIHSASGHEMQVILTNLASEHYKKRFVKAVNVLGDL